MGFSLELFFKKLNELIKREQKAGKTLKELKILIAEQ